MTQPIVDNLNVTSQEILITPEQLKSTLPLPEASGKLVSESRDAVRALLNGTDPRLFVVVGPCSIHDTKAAIDYAQRLKNLADEVSDTLLIIMRVYFEKPRTTVGWKGLINDPHLDDTFEINEGLHLARQLLLDILALGLPAATEALDPIAPQYLQDCITWSAIGARTTESQTHREMASGLSCPVGFKNGTDGSLSTAINAIQSATQPHRFLGINKQGQVAITETKGNPYAHIVLRGGTQGPNYDAKHIADCEAQLRQAGAPNAIMVDCSHANANKQAERQPLVVKDVIQQIQAGNPSIVGLMIESNIHAGKQSIPNDLSQLRYGVSITDECMGWEATEEAIKMLQTQLKDVLSARRNG